MVGQPTYGQSVHAQSAYGQPAFSAPRFDPQYDPSIAPISPKFSGFFGQSAPTPPANRPVSPAVRGVR